MTGIDTDTSPVDSTPEDEAIDDDRIHVSFIGIQREEASDGPHALIRKVINSSGQVRTSSTDITTEVTGESDSGNLPKGVEPVPKIIAPPVPPLGLIAIFSRSSALRSNIDAYKVNIDGFGHRVVGAIDFDDDDLDNAVEDVMRLEVMAEKGMDAALSADISGEEVEARIDKLKTRTRLERGILNQFLRTCCPDEPSFIELRKKTRHDLEVTGNAAWEVIRNAAGRITQFVHVPSQTLLITKLAPPIEAPVVERVNAVTLKDSKRTRRFRMYAQKIGTKTTYFKALGDPRAVSKNGRIYPDQAALIADKQEPANELQHFSIYAQQTPYGVPRWFGATLAVVGSILSEEVNHDYFDNKTIPPLAIIIEGGKKIGDKGVAKLSRAITDQVRGKDNFHKVLVMEAPLVQGSTKKPSMRFEALTKAQQDDGLFQKYDERNIDKTGTSFRLPRLVRGDSRDFNRATAQSALQLAEDQVFQPLRDAFDAWFNAQILPLLGLATVRFETQTLTVRDPERLSAMVRDLMRVGAITPGEAREIASDIFNRAFRKIDAHWVDLPITLSLAGVQTSQTTPSGEPIEADAPDEEGGDEGGEGDGEDG